MSKTKFSGKFIATAAGFTEKSGSARQLIANAIGRTGALNVAYLTFASDEMPWGWRPPVHESLGYMDQRLGWKVKMLTSEMTESAVMQTIWNCNVIHAEGGDSKRLMYWFDKFGIIKQELLSWIESGKHYIGSSSGAMALGQKIGVSRLDPKLACYISRDIRYRHNSKGIGILPGVTAVFPHFNPADRRQVWASKQQILVGGNPLLLTDTGAPYVWTPDSN